jgi:hypothetical protein
MSGAWTFLARAQERHACHWIHHQKTAAARWQSEVLPDPAVKIRDESLLSTLPISWCDPM